MLVTDAESQVEQLTLRGADISEWQALVRRLAPRRLLDISPGSGDLAEAIRRDDPAVDVLSMDVAKGEIPLEEEFDLIVASADPFAHLMGDAARMSAIADARRLLARDGLLIFEGLYVPPQEDATAAGPDGLVRERTLPGGVRVREVWRALGGHRYDVMRSKERDGVAEQSRARVRAWHCGETALRESAARIAGALDERDFDPWGDRLVAVIPGWS